MKKDWNYVYKIWYKDPGYEKYVEWMLDHQKNSHVPKVKKKLVKLSAFNFRPDDESFDTINILKIEKLRKPNDKEKRLIKYFYGNFNVIEEIIFALDQHKTEVNIDGDVWLHLTGEVLPKNKKVDLAKIFLLFPIAKSYFETLASFDHTLKNTPHAELDMSVNNVMVRDSDGAFVIIDPAFDPHWHELLYQKFGKGYKEISGKTTIRSIFNNADIDKASSSIVF
jgi:hypothetical protein